jgi:hypothetical protein
MTITVVGNDLNDINRQLGRVGPAFDFLIKFCRDDYGRRQLKGGILTMKGEDVPVKCETTEELLAVLAGELEKRDAWIDRTDGGTKMEAAA